jgi:hypothetical protein
MLGQQKMAVSDQAERANSLWFFFFFFFFCKLKYETVLNKICANVYKHRATWQGYAQISFKARSSGFNLRVVHVVVFTLNSQESKEIKHAQPLPQRSV